MKKTLAFVLAVCISLPLFSQIRGHINIPDILGFYTLKTDFHMHTVFSDGTVWPTVRVEEAYREGLDAISITDHLEVNFRPFRNDIVGSHNRPYEIAAPLARERDIILIRGSEITRGMPPGHFNAIFLTDSDPLETPYYRDALRIARDQGAFIFWNHPGWAVQQPDTTLWWSVHTSLLEEGLIHGIEVVNTDYYPEAFQWCLDKNLTIIGTSDLHGPSLHTPENRRNMTLVFARERTAEGIYEALRERRTAVFAANNLVIGEERFLRELFNNSLEYTVERRGNTTHVRFRNNSDFTFNISKNGHDERVRFRHLTISPNETITTILRTGENLTDVNLIVDNFLVQPRRGMAFRIELPNE